jgi:hypothetical protein
MDAIIEILSEFGVESIDEMELNESYTIEMEAVNDLTVEKVGKNVISVGQYYTQRMDLMSDPEIRFRVENGEWTPTEFTQHPRIYQYDEDGLDLDGFPTQWSKNLRKQGFVQKAGDVAPA